MIFFKSRCYNGGTKHKYKPRFTEKENNKIKEYHTRFFGRDSSSLKDLLLHKEYVHDICQWCGDIKK